MIHTLLVTLLIPLVLLFSVSVKAVDSNERSLLKGGLLESVYELPSTEVAPDLDHALQYATQTTPCELSRNTVTLVEESHPASIVSDWCCRGPPKS